MSIGELSKANKPSRVKEFMRLIQLRFSVKAYSYKEQSAVIFRFYRGGHFFSIDLALFLLYFLSNPYRICRRFLQKKGKDEIYAYGETPLTTMYKISRVCGIHASDTVVELGSGRGRGCFYLANQIGCRVIGVEWIPIFVRKARFLAKLFCMKNVTFAEQDFFEADLSKANVVYLYGTLLNQKEIDRFLENSANIQKGTKVITISYSLADLAPDQYRLVKRFSVSFPWGTTRGFLQMKN